MLQGDPWAVDAHSVLLSGLCTPSVLLQGFCAKPTDQPLQQSSSVFLIRVRTSQEKGFTNSGDALSFAYRDCLKLLLQIRPDSKSQAGIFLHPQNLST